MKGYLETQEVKPHVRKAMKNQKIVSGMTTREVRLVMKARSEFDADPYDVAPSGKGEIWIYKSYKVTDPDWLRLTITDGVIQTVEASKQGIRAKQPR